MPDGPSLDREKLRLENIFGALGLALVDKMQRAFETQTGLGPSAVAAVIQIGTAPGLSIEALRRMIALSHSATVRLVDQLSLAGLVIRLDGGEADKRAKRLQLTPEGRDVFARCVTARRAVIERAVGRLDEAETAQLGLLAAKLLPGLVELGDDQNVVCRVCDQGVCEHARCPITLMG